MLLLPLFCYAQTQQRPPGKPPSDAPGPDLTRLFSTTTQESRGDWKFLRGGCRIVTDVEEVNADEIDYNSVTNEAYLRGHVRYRNFEKGDSVEAARGQYNLKSQRGSFYEVKGTTPATGSAEPWLLRTTNPFYFEGEWAERFHDRYVIHNGYLTDCTLPKPWWTLHANQFDVVPGQRAIAKRAIFRIRELPVFYFPAFYRPLGRKDRQSGFLAPTFGRSTYLGYMFGDGYYWAINRSYDMTYAGQYLSQRGISSRYDFRGKPTQSSDFDFNLYSVKDRGPVLGDGVTHGASQGGVQFEFIGKTNFGDGWTGKIDFRYLSSYLFRQAFTQSFNESILSENNSVGSVQKHWRDYTVNIGLERKQLFESVLPKDLVTIQKFPTVDFIGKDRQLFDGPVPLWYSFDTNVSLMRRQEPAFQTGNFVDRQDAQPNVFTSFNFKGFELLPQLTFHLTRWGDSLIQPSLVSTQSVYRKAADANIEFIVPPVERVFRAPSWLGQKIKHVIEPRLNYRYVGGVNNIDRIIRFDENDLLTNTNQLKISIMNRLYLKNKSGKVNEVLNWEVAQERYFDPTFGGAVVTGQSNILPVTEDLTPYTFITRPRNYSPVDSVLRFFPTALLGIDWRIDYDPVYRRLTNNNLQAVYRFRKKYVLSGGYRELFPDPIIQNSVNVADPGIDHLSQVTGSFAYGGSLQKGFGFAASSYYDLSKHQVDYVTSQVNYNTDCCGFNVEIRRFALGVRNENQVMFSFVIANVGSFGTLRHQDRIF